MAEPRVYELLLWGMFAVAGATAVLSAFTTAPYGGRFERPWWSGPLLPSRLAWTLMELPQPVGFGLCFALAERPADAAALALLGMWMFHYAYRTLIYPWIPRASTMGLSVVVLGMVLNSGFSYLNGRWLFALGPARGAGWLSDPRFLAGVVLFFGGFVLACSSDLILRRLRRPGETGYRLPTGGGFRWISSPHYLGEIVQWTGWTLASWSLAGLTLVAVSAANLVPRAWRNHRWNRRRFPDYPPERRALLPYIW